MPDELSNANFKPTITLKEIQDMADKLDKIESRSVHSSHVSGASLGVSHHLSSASGRRSASAAKADSWKNPRAGAATSNHACSAATADAETAELVRQALRARSLRASKSRSDLDDTNMEVLRVGTAKYLSRVSPEQVQAHISKQGSARPFPPMRLERVSSSPGSISSESNCGSPSSSPLKMAGSKVAKRTAGMSTISLAAPMTTKDYGFLRPGVYVQGSA